MSTPNSTPVRIAIRAAAGVSICAAVVALSPAVASAQPGPDFDGDGAVASSEFLDAPLVPQQVLPGRDTDSDGALSAAEAVGLEGSSSSVSKEWRGRVYFNDYYSHQDIEGPDGSLWRVSIDYAAPFTWGKYSMNFRLLSSTSSVYRFEIEDATGDVYHFHTLLSFPGRVHGVGYNSADPTIVRVKISM